MVVKTRTVIIQIFPVLLGSLTTGNNLGWFSPGLSKLKSGEDVAFHVDSGELANFPICHYGGSIISLLWIFLIRDKISRRQQLLLAYCSFLAAWILTACAFHMWILYVAKLLGGFANGQSFIITPIYLGEIAPDDIRGCTCALFESGILAGVVIANALVPQVSLTTSSIVFAVFPLVAICLLYVCSPESPYYLVMKKRPDLARQALCKLRGAQDVDTEFAKVQSTVLLQMTRAGSFKEVYTQRSNMRGIVIITGILTVQCFSGFPIVTLFLHIILQEFSTTIPINALSFALISINCVSSFACSFLIDRVGKRRLVISSCIGCAIAMASFSVCKHLRSVHYESDALSAVVVVSLAVYLAFHASGIGLVPLTYTGEVFPVNIKLYAVFIVKLYVFGIYLIINKIHQLVTIHLNDYAEFYAYTICSILGIIFSVLVLPETKQKSFHEIQLLLGAKYDRDISEIKPEQVPLTNKSEIARE